MEHFKLLTGRTDREMSIGKYRVHMHKVRDTNLLFVEIIYQDHNQCEITDMKGTFDQYYDVICKLLTEATNVHELVSSDGMNIRNVMEIIQSLDFNQE
jgi:hypothetical protein